MAASEQVQSRRGIIQKTVIIICILLVALQVVEFDFSQLNPSRTTDNKTDARGTISDAASALDDSNSFCIFTKTAPHSFDVRSCLRNKCHYQDSAAVQHMFLVGEPSYAKRNVKAHKQGDLASEKEVRISKMILEESNTFQDVLAVPYRDLEARDASVKQLEALKFGVNHNCSFTVIVDDMYCVDVSRIKDMVATASNTEKIYFGYKWIPPENNVTRIPYLAGGYVGVSQRLASFIVQPDWTHSVMTSHKYTGGGNESSSEAYNLGKWVEYAKDKHNFTVTYMAESRNVNETLRQTCSSGKRFENITYEHDLCIVTLSGASMFDSRQCQRKICRPTYGNIPHLFAVGIPSDVETEDPTLVGDLPSSQEVNISSNIIAEQEKFGDILATLHKDYYVDLPEKRIAVLRYGLENKCAYTIKVDDEYCVDVAAVRQLIAKHEQHYPNEELYFGNYLWKGTEYEIMQGPNGENVPYMSGHCNGASYKLASYIVNQDWTHTVMRAHYGSSSEDVDMGFWVDYAMKKHILQVQFVANGGIRNEIPKDACSNS